MNLNTPTLLEERIAAAGDPDKLPTVEERELAALNSSQLYKDKLGEAGAGIDPQLALKRQLGRYHNLSRPKMSATKVYKCRELLEQGEDPFMLAIYFNADFGAVASIANDVLRVRAEAKGQTEFQTVPTTVHGYLKRAQEIETARSEAPRTFDLAELTTLKIQIARGDPGDGVQTAARVVITAGGTDFFWPKLAGNLTHGAKYDAEVSVPNVLKHISAGLVNSLDQFTRPTKTKESA